MSQTFFFEITQYNADTQHARTLTPMNTRTQTLPLWAPSKDWVGKSWSSRSHHRRLAVDGHVAYHLMHSAEKSWNKSRIKCRTQDLNPGWEPPNQWPLPLRREPLGDQEVHKLFIYAKRRRGGLLASRAWGGDGVENSGGGKGGLRGAWHPPTFP